MSEKFPNTPKEPRGLAAHKQKFDTFLQSLKKTVSSNELQQVGAALAIIEDQDVTPREYWEEVLFFIEFCLNNKIENFDLTLESVLRRYRIHAQNQLDRLPAAQSEPELEDPTPYPEFTPLPTKYRTKAYPGKTLVRREVGSKKIQKEPSQEQIEDLQQLSVLIYEFFLPVSLNIIELLLDNKPLPQELQNLDLEPFLRKIQELELIYDGSSEKAKAKEPLKSYIIHSYSLLDLASKAQKNQTQTI